MGYANTAYPYISDSRNVKVSGKADIDNLHSFCINDTVNGTFQINFPFHMNSSPVFITHS